MTWVLFKDTDWKMTNHALHMTVDDIGKGCVAQIEGEAITKLCANNAGLGERMQCIKARRDHRLAHEAYMQRKTQREAADQQKKERAEDEYRQHYKDAAQGLCVFRYG
jgi:hypothetical protein